MGNDHYIYIFFEEIMDHNGLFLITTHNPEFPGLKKIVCDNWDLLKRS